MARPGVFGLIEKRNLRSVLRKSFPVHVHAMPAPKINGLVDEEDRLLLMIHSGSRALGQAIRDHHLAGAQLVDGRFRALDAESEQGAVYLHDLDWARRYAAASRRAMAAEVERVIQDAMGAYLLWETSITTDHNHVALEQHGVSKFWVHRKGAMDRGIMV